MCCQQQYFIRIYNFLHVVCACMFVCVYLSACVHVCVYTHACVCMRVRACGVHACRQVYKQVIYKNLMVYVYAITTIKTNNENNTQHYHDF